MARRCELTGKDAQTGHKVSHSNVKSKRRFDPNLQSVTLYSDALRRRVRMRVSMRALRSVQRRGGLDSYLLKADDASLAETGQRLKRQVKKALAGESKAAAASS